MGSKEGPPCGRRSCSQRVLDLARQKRDFVVGLGRLSWFKVGALNPSQLVSQQGWTWFGWFQGCPEESARFWTLEVTLPTNKDHTANNSLNDSLTNQPTNQPTGISGISVYGRSKVWWACRLTCLCCLVSLMVGYSFHHVCKLFFFNASLEPHPRARRRAALRKTLLLATFLFWFGSVGVCPGP